MNKMMTASLVLLASVSQSVAQQRETYDPPKFNPLAYDGRKITYSPFDAFFARQNNRTLIAPGYLPFGKSAGDRAYSIYIENHGNKSIALAIETHGGKRCAVLRMKPAEAAQIMPCGPMFVWDDTTQMRSMELAGGGVFQIFWDGARWDIKEITKDRE